MDGKACRTNDWKEGRKVFKPMAVLNIPASVKPFIDLPFHTLIRQDEIDKTKRKALIATQLMPFGYAIIFKSNS